MFLTFYMQDEMIAHNSYKLVFNRFYYVEIIQIVGF